MKTQRELLTCDTDGCKNFLIVPDMENKDFIALRKKIGWTRVAKENKDYCTNCSNPDIKP